MRKDTIPPFSKRTAPPKGRLSNKLIRTVVVILAVVSGLTLVTVFQHEVESQADQQAAIARFIKKGLEDKGRVLTENHALALRGMVEDNAFGDVQALVARTIREDSEVITGLYLPEQGKPWAFFSPEDPPPDSESKGLPGPPSDAWKKLGIAAGAIKDDTMRISSRTWFGEPVLAFSKAVISDGEVLGTIHYGVSIRLMRSELGKAKKLAREKMRAQIILLASLAGGGMLLGLVLALREAKLITRPLALLTDAAEQIQRGNRGARANVHSGDEIELLAGAFNQMIEDLEYSAAELERMNRGLEETVAQRTAELSERNKEMRVVLDNVEAGLVTVALDGTLSKECSAAFKRAFVAPANDVKVWEVFGEESFEARLEFGWEQVADGFLPWDVALDQLPSRLVTGGRSFDLAFKPIVDEGAEEAQLKGALLIITDVTEKLAAARAEAKQKQAMAVFRRVMQDRDGFGAFFQEVRGMVSQIRSGEVQSLALMMRLVHTVKGNCAIFGITSVAEACHELESWVVENQALPEEAQFVELDEAWGHFQTQVGELLGEEEEHALLVPEQEMLQLMQAVSERKPAAKVVALIERMRCEKTAVRFERIGEQARQLARKLKKQEPAVVIEDNDVRLPADRWSGFWGAFIHLVRNALDHGIEESGDRVAQNKPEVGTIVLVSRIEKENFVIELSDDGAGIDWDKLKNKAKGYGLPCDTQADLVEALFHDGISSKDETTELSGRGVGMGAVREACSALGGHIDVKTVRGSGTSFRFVIPMANNDRVAGRAA